MHLRRPQFGHNDPQHHMISSQNWGRGDATDNSSPGRDMDPELTEKRKKQAQNARELQTQMQQNKERREREKQNEERRREKEEADLNNYNPFGRGGAGAPLRNEYGDVQANLREVTREAPNPNGTRYDGPAPPVNDLLERTRPGMGGGRMDHRGGGGDPPGYAPPPSYAPMPGMGGGRMLTSGGGPPPSGGQRHMTPRGPSYAPPPMPGYAPPPHSPTRQGISSMFGGDEHSYEKQQRQKKYVSELEEQMRENQNRRQREAAVRSEYDAKHDKDANNFNKWSDPTARGTGSSVAPTPQLRFAPPPMHGGGMITPGGMMTPGMTPGSMMPSPGGFGGMAPAGFGGAPLPRQNESHGRVTAPWDGRLQASGGLGGGGMGEYRLGAIPEGDHSDEIRLKATLSEPRYAEPVVRGATREAELSRMLEWERDRAREAEFERRREREQERARESTRQGEYDRLAERQKEWEQRMQAEEGDRRRREEQRLSEDIAAMRRDFFAQQRQIMSQVEEQLARMRATAVAAASVPPGGLSPPNASHMPTRSTLLYADGSLQPAAGGASGSSPLMAGMVGMGSAGREPSAPPQQQQTSISPPPGANGSFGSAGGEGEGDVGLGLGFSLLTAGMSVADDGDRAPEEIDQLLLEFLGKASD
eukprot:scaffold40_cov66-Phaeocystis_antarctica.AAC.2